MCVDIQRTFSGPFQVGPQDNISVFLALILEHQKTVCHGGGFSIIIIQYHYHQYYRRIRTSVPKFSLVDHPYRF